MCVNSDFGVELCQGMKSSPYILNLKYSSVQLNTSCVRLRQWFSTYIVCATFWNIIFGGLHVIIEN